MEYFFDILFYHKGTKSMKGHKSLNIFVLLCGLCVFVVKTMGPGFRRDDGYKNNEMTHKKRTPLFGFPKRGDVHRLNL
jgi:hypothetical protein